MSLTTTKEGNNYITRNEQGRVIRTGTSPPGENQFGNKSHSGPTSGGSSGSSSSSGRSSTSGVNSSEDKRRAELEKQGYTTVEANAIIRGVPVDDSIKEQRTGQARQEIATFSGRVGNTVYTNLTKQEIESGKLSSNTIAKVDPTTSSRPWSRSTNVPEYKMLGQTIGARAATPVPQEQLRRIDERISAQQRASRGQATPVEPTRFVIQEAKPLSTRKKIALTGVTGITREKLQRAAAGTPSGQIEFIKKTGASITEKVLGVVGAVTDPIAKFIAGTPDQRASQLRLAKETVQAFDIREVPATISAGLATVGPTIKREPQQLVAEVALGFGAGAAIRKGIKTVSGSAKYTQATKPPADVRVSSVKTVGGKEIVSEVAERGKIQTVTAIPSNVKTIRRTGTDFSQVTKIDEGVITQTTINRISPNKRLRVVETIKNNKASVTVTEIVTGKQPKKVFTAKDIPVESGAEALPQARLRTAETRFKREEILQRPEGALVRQREKLVNFKEGKPISATTIQAPARLEPITPRVSAAVQLEKSTTQKGLRTQRLTRERVLTQVEPRGPTRIQVSEFVGQTPRGVLQFQPKSVTIEPAKIVFGKRTEFPDVLIKPTKTPGQIASVRTPDIRKTVIRSTEEIVRFRKQPPPRESTLIFSSPVILPPQELTDLVKRTITFKPSALTSVPKGRAAAEFFKARVPSRIGFAPMPRLGEAISPVSRVGITPQSDLGFGATPDISTFNIVSPVIDTKLSPTADTKPISVVDTTPITRTTTTPISDTIQISPLINITSTTSNIPKFRTLNPVTPIVPFIPFIFNTQKRTAEKTFAQDAYNVFVREKGKFVKANEEPLPYNSAWNLGASVTDNTPSATFTLRKSKQKVDSKTQRDTAKDLFLVGKFKQKGKGNIFEEQNKFRIDTQGELTGITVKGWLASRDKAASKRALNNFLR